MVLWQLSLRRRLSLQLLFRWLFLPHQLMRRLLRFRLPIRLLLPLWLLWRRLRAISWAVVITTGRRRLFTTQGHPGLKLLGTGDPSYPPDECTNVTLSYSRGA